MENLSIEEYKELLIYYKGKVSELELNYLLLQLNHKKIMAEKQKNLDDDIAIYRKAIEDERSKFMEVARKELQKNKLKKKVVEKKPTK